MEIPPAEPETPRTTPPVEEEQVEQLREEPRRQPFKDPSWMTRNIRKDNRIALLLHGDVKATSAPVTTTDGYAFLASYSWKQSAAPTIYVPGTPPKWSPPPLPTQLEKDQGGHWVDQHGHRTSRFQFEPIFQALTIMNPNVAFDNVDIVVNRNSLLKLYSFASFKRHPQFYLDLDMIGKTLFISRRESRAKTHIQDGYGGTFEKKFTSKDPELADAEGHHRIIQYRLGRLNIVVRIEADAYFSDEHADTSNTNTPNEVFLNFLGEMQPASAAIAHTRHIQTNVIPKGTLMPHHRTVELKSNNDKQGATTQAWFGRTRNLIFGMNKKGLINSTSIRQLQDKDFADWAEKNQLHLRRLAWLLVEVRTAVKEKTKGAAVLVATEKGAPLQIFEAFQSFGALPKPIIKRFWSEDVAEG